MTRPQIGFGVLGFTVLAVIASAGCDARADWVTIGWGAVDFTSETPIAGARTCVQGRPDIGCATTDSAGIFQLEVPPHTDLLLLNDAPAYAPWSLSLHTNATDWIQAMSLQWFPALMIDLIYALMSNLGLDVDRDKPLVVLFVSESQEAIMDRQHLAGVTAALSNDATPYYMSADGNLDLSLTATSESGGLAFINVEPGEYTLTVRHPGRSCAGLMAWPGSQENQYRIAVVEGYHAISFAACQ